MPPQEKARLSYLSHGGLNRIRKGPGAWDEARAIYDTMTFFASTTIRLNWGIWGADTHTPPLALGWKLGPLGLLSGQGG